MFDNLWTNINIATMAEGQGFGIIKNAAIGIQDKKIAWIGAESDLPGKAETLSDYLHDGRGQWATPGLIDCHTQIIYADDNASEQELFDAALSRLKPFFHEGVMTFEIKPGTDAEGKIQRVAEKLRDELDLRLRTSPPATHPEYPDEAGIKKMARDGTAAVLFPGIFYFLREKKLPPIELFRKYKVPMAVATGHNPETAPTLSLLLMLNMACVLFGLTPEEALAGATVNAARALGYQDICGTLEKGKAADFALWNITAPRDLCHHFGHNPCTGVVMAGEYHRFER